MELLSIVLYAIGMALVIAEIVLPGVVLGIIGAGAAVAGIWLGFEANPALGIGELVAAVIFVPTAFWWGIRRMRLDKTIATEPPTEDLSKLVGKTGEVVHDLRPGGTIVIDGARYDAAATSGYLERGTKVSVVKAEGNKVFVRAV